MKKAVIAKRISQFVFLSIFIYILWSTTYPLKGLLPAETFFKLNPLIMIVTSISERLILAGIIFSFVMLLLTLIFGRFFCGWVCPLGTMIDIAGYFNKGRRQLTDAQNRKLRSPKFFILSVVFIASFFGLQIAWILDPMVISARLVSLNLIPTTTLLINRSLEGLIKTFGLYGWLYDFYRSLQTSFLGVKIRFFAHSIVIFLFFYAIIVWAVYLKRSWCRGLCPLGAFYALFAKPALLKRKVEKCNRCMKCKTDCRMGAIKDGLDYVQSECVLCMDCVYDCPQKSTSFVFADKKKEDYKGEIEKGPIEKAPASGISRRNFLALAFFSLFPFNSQMPARQKVIRPPAALKEEEFLNRCIRCGNCMKVCITNGLQPALLQAGLSGIWTPHLVPEIGYCEYRCTLCGNVCPTQAIPKLTVEEKVRTRLGLAKIDRKTCIPWKKKKNCIVCEEHCPIPNKAIKLKKFKIGDKIVLRPYINQDLCTGCAICQTKCPVRPDRAIKVYPVKVTHGKNQGPVSIKI
jgi:MauM/NapG family ferredoxin protein